AAEQLAGHAGIDRSLAYTVGLLHGVGLISLDAWRQSTPPVRRFPTLGLPSETVAAEEREFGFNNATVAAALLRLWEFPPSIVDPICWQYEPQAAKDEPLMACLLHTAKWLRDAAHVPDEQPLPPEPEEWIMNTLHLSSTERRLPPQR